MKRLLLETSFSKIYMIAMIIITLLILGGYFSYAMFTVSKERGNAISIVTGNLTYDLKVDGSTGDTLTVPAGETKTFTITLSNPNNRTARFNFYYVGSLPSNVKAGYIAGDGVNTPPVEVGTNLEKVNTTGSSNTYTIRVSNKSGSSAMITLGVGVGLDYNDLSLPDNGHLFEEVSMLLSDIVIDNLSSGSTYNDEIDTFITGGGSGENPNNYVWYSGKLWRAVSVNNEAKTTKLITQWNISAISYSSGSSAFEGSYIEDWLNDTTVDGFLGNLREPDKFIVMDAKWNATENTTSNIRPSETTMVTDAVGLLNSYESNSTYAGASSSKRYLNNNGMYSWTLTPSSSSSVWALSGTGGSVGDNTGSVYGVRPVINIKSTIKVVKGSGTESDPYRLEGDNDTNLSGTPLSSRYSGEYITFGTDNNLYRIVSHETEGLTKITSAEPLRKNGTFKIITFGETVNYSTSSIIGTFLNGDYLKNYVGDNYDDMIEDNSVWYLGNLIFNTYNYKLAKYSNENMDNLTSNIVIAKIGLLRYGELMAGQFDGNSNNTTYWMLTPMSFPIVWNVRSDGRASNGLSRFALGVKPSLNLKQNVVITGGDGTKQNPFELSID